MKAKLAFLVLYAILLTSVDCIKVVDDTDENNNSNNTSTTVMPASVVEDNEDNPRNITEIESKESRTIDDDDDKLEETTMPSNIHKIPPTLQNVKNIEQVAKENPVKSLKDFANPTPASIRNQNSLPEGKLKQAIIHSKQQSFKNLIDHKSGKLKDQIARPNEVQPDISVETPPQQSAKEFVPSPELSPLYIPENNHQDHFHPLNQYYRPPTKHDAYFSQDNSFNSQPQVDAKWLGNNRSPNNNNNVSPNDVNPQFMHQQGMIRNTQIEFPYHHEGRHVHFHSPHDYYHFKHYHHNHGSSSNGDRMVFPNDGSPFSEEIRTTTSFPSWPSKNTELSKNEKPKGSWKWVPEEEDEIQTIEQDIKSFQAFNFPPSFYESHKPQTVKDRPYSFESSEIFSHHTTPPTGPGTTARLSGTAEALTSEEHTIGKEHGDDDKGKVEVKILRPAPPWKRFLHVMTAAIPIGIIISALTPRFVYIHPNATAPTLQPAFSQQPFSPPSPIPSSALQQNTQFQQAGPNVPFPLRQRAIHANHFNHHVVNESFIEFMKFMESKYREKHGKINDTCEDKFFCETALKGADPNAEYMYRTLYQVAIETPQSHAEKSGLKEIFTAIKRHNCEVFKCKKT